ncbi:MAG: hypothetical protein HUJ51_06290 [Eggerthellaceae bacterium]|nr:hypothetical protein [Eggerthellaceae bacterium]
MLSIKSANAILKKKIVELHGSIRIFKREHKDYISRIDEENKELTRPPVYFHDYLEEELKQTKETLY